MSLPPLPLLSQSSPPQALATLQAYDVTLVRIHKELEIRLRAQMSFPASCYQTVRSFVLETLLGRPSYTLEELFDLQLSTLHDLTRTLADLNDYARTELLRLQQYSESLTKTLCRDLTLREAQEAELSVGITDYLRQRATLFPQGSAPSLDQELQFQQVHRDLLEAKHQYALTLDEIADAQQERVALPACEDFLRASLYFSERLTRKTARIERHLHHTKRTYQVVHTQQQALTALHHALRTLKDYTEDVHRTLAGGMAELTQLFDAPPSEIYRTLPEHLRVPLADLQRLNSQQDSSRPRESR